MGKQLLLSLFNRSLQSVRLGGLTGCVAHLQFRKNRPSNTIVHLIAVTLLLTCLPLLATAQLVPLKTFQASLFAQTPEKKKEMEKPKTRKMDEKEYKDESRIKVKDPALFAQSEENKIFSGPQPGEKLPLLMVTGFRGEIEGQTYDITTKSDGEPLVLFLQDTNAVGVKGLVNVFGLLLKIDAFQKRHNEAMGAEKSNQGLQIGVVFLADSLDTLPDWAHNMLNKEISNEILTGISPDGREGPGSYGLNRNVAQTVIVAKDGKVLHNFAFTQPMLYADPHFLGAIAQAIEADIPALEKWLNDDAAKRYAKKNVGKKSVAAQFAALREAVVNGKISREEAAEGVKKLGITWEEGEKLLDKTKETSQKMDRPQYRNQRQVKIADPAAFNTSEENKIFSGPQPGEKLPPLNAISVIGESASKTLDFTKTDGQPLMLFLQSEDGAGLRGLYDISRMIAKIANESKQKLQMNVVFLGDDPDALHQSVSGVARGIAKSMPKNVLLGISPESREGPGNYGLNRNVEQTILIAKDGKVLHNFAFTQPMVYADPYVLGAIVQVIGEDPVLVEKWLNEAPTDEERRQRDRQRMNQEGARNSEQDLSLEKLVKPFDKDGDGKLNKKEGMAMRRALVNRESEKNRESQNPYRREKVEVKNPAEFKKGQGATLFSGPQPGEKLPPLKVKGINGETKDETYDVIAKADGQLLVLFLQDESGLGLRGLLGISRLLAQIAEKSKQTMHISAVFLGDTPDTLENQASKLVSHIPSEVLLSISQDGREGPGSYGLNRNVAQTVIIAKDGNVLHNFAFMQSMLRPDPYVLGAVGDAIGVEPTTLEKWLNVSDLTIAIKNPTEGETTGKILLNGNVVQLDELRSRLLNLPEEQKSMLIIQSGQEVSHEQTVQVMDIAKEAGIDKIEFAISPAEDKSMEPDKAQELRSKD